MSWDGSGRLRISLGKGGLLYIVIIKVIIKVNIGMDALLAITTFFVGAVKRVNTYHYFNKNATKRKNISFSWVITDFLLINRYKSFWSTIVRCTFVYIFNNFLILLELY